MFPLNYGRSTGSCVWFRFDRWAVYRSILCGPNSAYKVSVLPIARLHEVGHEKWPLISLETRIFPHTFGTTRFLSPTASFDHGCRVPATERARWCSLNSKHGHRRPKLCEGNLKHCTHKSYLWFCQRPSRHHQSELPSVHIGRLLVDRIQDSMVNRTDHVELGLICADVCRALDRGINGRQPDQFSRSVFEAIGQLTT